MPEDAAEARQPAEQSDREENRSRGLPDDVDRFVSEIVQRFTPEQIILFGSHADGTATPDSDVDLLVVMEFEGRPVDMAVRIGAECDDRFPMDLIVRRPEDLRRALETGDPFMKGIVEKGKVLYVRPA